MLPKHYRCTTFNGFIDTYIIDVRGNRPDVIFEEICHKMGLIYSSNQHLLT